MTTRSRTGATTKKTKSAAGTSMPSYRRVMARLERLGRRVDVVRGTPMSIKTIDAMEKKLRVKLGADYRTFLQETGGLEVFDRKSGAGIFIIFGRSKGRFDAPLFKELPYYQPHADFGRCLVVSCEFAGFSREDTFGPGEHDPFSEVQEYVLMMPNGEGFMDVRGVACEGGGFATFRPELITFDEVFGLCDGLLNDVDPRGAADDDAGEDVPARPARPLDASAVEAMLARTIETTGAAALLFYVDGVELSADGKTATSTVGINLPAGTAPAAAKEPYVKALIDKARKSVLDEAGVTMKFRLFFDVVSPDYVEGDEQRHVAHLARLVSKLKRPDTGAELFLDWVESRLPSS